MWSGPGVDGLCVVHALGVTSTVISTEAGSQPFPREKINEPCGLKATGHPRYLPGWIENTETLEVVGGDERFDKSIAATNIRWAISFFEKLRRDDGANIVMGLQGFI